MKTSFLLIVAGLSLTAPALAQDWGSDYNMGTIGVVGGTETSGTITINCAEAGNGTVEQGSLAVFVTPAAGVTATAGDFIFTIGGEDVTLAFVDNQGDGFYHDKTPDSLDALQALIDGLASASEVVITEANNEIARIDLEGAGEALDGVEACLV